MNTSTIFSYSNFFFAKSVFYIDFFDSHDKHSNFP